MSKNDSLGRKNILLVDDDAAVRDVIRSALEKEYNVIEASGYQEVIKQIKKPIDLALIDYMLPESDGFDVLKALREVRPTLPAIMMTAYSNERLVIKALRSAVADYVKKPLRLAYLRKRLSEILGGRSGEENAEELETREEFILEGMAAHIQENYMKDLTLDKLASMACMNRFKLSKAFKERFGQTFTSYLNAVRVKGAAELLKNPDLSISEISHSVGYASVVHFDRVFRTVHGISPREYRKRISSEARGILQ